MTTKICIKCKNIRDLSLFYPDRPKCKICVQEASDAYYQKHKVEYKEFRKQKRKEYFENPANIIERLKHNISILVAKSLNIKFSEELEDKIILHFGDEYFINLKEHLENVYFSISENNWMEWKIFGIIQKQNRLWNLDNIKRPFDYPFDSMQDDNFKIIWDINNLFPIDSKQKETKKRRELDRIIKIKDPSLKLRHNISVSVWTVLKGNNSSKFGKSIKEFLGQNYFINLKKHLALLFLRPGNEWMSWKNYSTYDIKTWDDNDNSTWTWNLDHICPQSLLPYQTMEDDNFKLAWDLENLRPYSAKLNISECNRRTEEEILKIKEEIKIFLDGVDKS